MIDVMDNLTILPIYKKDRHTGDEGIYKLLNRLSETKPKLFNNSEKMWIESGENVWQISDKNYYIYNKKFFYNTPVSDKGYRQLNPNLVNRYFEPIKINFSLKKISYYSL
tara:strand:+ start:173 stop:502 length:330 start_codon:yes stop_codon:yes gene_type:complete